MPRALRRATAPGAILPRRGARQMKPPLGPALPDYWTPEVDAAATAHAQEAYPNEAAGMIDAAGIYHRLANIAETTAADEIHLSDEDMLRVASDAVCFFHSHPDGIGCPSADDMIYQQQLGIPFVI